MFNEPNFVKEFTEYVTGLGIKKALEVGCYSGELRSSLVSTGVMVDGIDINPRLADIEKVDVREHKTRKYYNLVFSSGLIEHYSHEDAIDILKSKARVSRQYVLTYVPNSECVAYMNRKSRATAAWKNELDYDVIKLALLHEEAGLTVKDSGVAGAEWAKRFGPEPSEPYLVYCLATKLRE
jgi:hypothetical protein